MWSHACMFPRLNLSGMIQVHYRLQNYRSWATQVSMFVYINIIDNIDIHNCIGIVGRLLEELWKKNPDLKCLVSLEGCG